jgi:hypothetical protein
MLLARALITIAVSLHVTGCDSEAPPPREPAPEDETPRDAATDSGDDTAGSWDAMCLCDGAIAVDAAMVRCAELDEAGCERASDECETIHAALLDEDAGRSERMFAACLPEDHECGDGDAGSCARHALSGDVYLFFTTCVPPGWERIDYNICNPV